MEHPAVQEVRRQHVMIEGWLRGDDRSGWDSFVAALDDRFEIVAPDGKITAKPALLDGFKGAFGALPGLDLDIRNTTLVSLDDQFALVRYEEWQRHEGNTTTRVSSAVMQASPTAPLGWAWVALHETWLAA